MNHSFQPFPAFADEVTSSDVNGLTFENQVAQIAVFGNTTITRDQIGLAQAEKLAEHINAIMSALKAEPNLPAKVELPVASVTTVANPFAN